MYEFLIYRDSIWSKYILSITTFLRGGSLRVNYWLENISRALGTKTIFMNNPSINLLS